MLLNTNVSLYRTSHKLSVIVKFIFQWHYFYSHRLKTDTNSLTYVLENIIRYVRIEKCY